MAGKRRGVSTLAVHAGERYDPATGAVGTPIYQNSTFFYPRKPDGKGRWVPNDEFIYTRYANPTVRAVEEKIAALEGAESAVCFASGMAATSAATLALVAPGEEIVSQASIYGGSTALFNNQFRQLGIRVSYAYEGDAEALARMVNPKTRVVFVEAPSNPFNRIVDLPRLRKILNEKWGAKRPRIVIDSTPASPVNFRPLKAGADVVVHSATKYLNGHADIIGGAVAASRKLIDRVRPWLKSLGGSMDPHAAFLLLRGLKTLPLRMARHNENATIVARFLSRHAAVESVWHPSLPSHPDHVLGKRLMKGFGAVIAVQLKSRKQAVARRFMERLELFAAAASFGGVESLVSLPIETQHAMTSVSDRKRLGITPTLVRLAIGVEDARDIVEDLRQALRGI